MEALTRYARTVPLGLVIGAIAVGAGAPATANDAAAAAGKGRLLVTERIANEAGIYEEGAISYLRVRRLRDRKIVIRRRYVGRRMRLDEMLPTGRYRLISFVRPCSGSCQTLDPARDRCTADFWLPRGAEARARIVTNDGSRCRIEFWSPYDAPEERR